MASSRIYENNGDGELEALYQAILGRGPFQYRAQDDPLYRSYADRYVQNGRMAMRDTMGSASALTGGYGSSYAQAAGQQQYDEYLRLLSEALPELYGMAYERYRDEGEALQDRYDMAYQREADAYARERDERAAAYQRERDALADERYRTEQQSKAEQQRYKQQQDSYQNLMKLISGSGYNPTDSELAAAGMSRASADALRKEYERENGQTQTARTVSYGGGTRSAAGTRESAADTPRTSKFKSTGKTSGSGGATGSAKSSGGFKGGLSQR